MSDKLLFSETRIRDLHRRALRMRTVDAAFLSVQAGREIAARLAVTNRDFRNVLVLDAFPEPLAEQISGAIENANIVSLDIALLGDDLELQHTSHELIVAGPALHRRNDLPGTLIQIRRALVPDGLFMGTLPGEGTLEELRQSLIAAEALVTGGAASRIDPFIEIRQAGSLLQRAGFALPVADSETLDLRYGDIMNLVRDLRANGASSALAEAVYPLRRLVFESAVGHYRKNHSDDHDRLKVSVSLVYLSGWAPHESQQKPLSPGSASHRLADFVGRKENE